jgi:uncharacterized membrane protein YeiH
MIRDTLGHVPSVLLGHEIYITASIVGGCTYVGLRELGVERATAMTVAFAVTFTLRGLAIRYGWSLPPFRESRKREPWKNEPKTPAGE